jgi:hypothetical protein
MSHAHASYGSSTTTSVTAAVIAIVVLATAPRAGAAGDPTRHVRALDPRLDALIEEGARRSPLFRSLLDAIERSTVIVYVQSRPLPARLGGRLTLTGAAAPWRYLRIEIECRQGLDLQIAALGHELQHAVEIAEAGAIVDQRSIKALYGRIGFAVDHGQRQFESDAARNAGVRIRRDLLSRAVVVSRR